MMKRWNSFNSILGLCRADATAALAWMYNTSAAFRFLCYHFLLAELYGTRHHSPSLQKPSWTFSNKQLSISSRSSTLWKVEIEYSALMVNSLLLSVELKSVSSLPLMQPSLSDALAGTLSFFKNLLILETKERDFSKATFASGLMPGFRPRDTSDKNLIPHHFSHLTFYNIYCLHYSS